MSSFVRPKVFASRCLGFEPCRWNGVAIPDPFVALLAPYVDFVTACPEKDIGLGVPRDPIRITIGEEAPRLRQLNTEKDVTAEMEAFCKNYVDGLSEVDGFILKDRSPSCGVKDVKVYKNLEKGAPIRKGNGFFGGAVCERFPNAALETEGRLNNFTIREHFLAKIFTLARFREARAQGTVRSLVQFHSENKFLLMAYNQKEMKAMGRITANTESAKPASLFEEYEQHLLVALKNPATFKSNINVLMHAFGFFSDQLTNREKRFFLNSLEEYRREQAPLSVPLNLIESYIERFDCEYLEQQTFFQPFPKQLTTISDSGKGRTLT